MRRSDFEPIFKAHADSLYGFLVYQCGDPALAEDVLADAFERALRARGRFDPERGEVKTWLFAIALNRLRDLQRRSASEGRAVDELAHADRSTEGFEDSVLLSDMLARALRRIPEDERRALALRYGGGMTVPEVAEVLDEPLERVEGRVYRGLRKLRAELETPGPSAGPPDPALS